VNARDPASLAVLLARLTGIATEMGEVLRRAAFSPNIKERMDASAALFTSGGELLVQAEHIPVHLGSMPASVAAVIGACREAARPGDHFVVNDPFAGGTHLNDVTLVTPCFVGEQLVGWAANRAHHADVGGAAPGSLPADARDVFAEGLRLPPLRMDDSVRAVILANTRTPVERAGDLDAQVGANALGVRRLAELLDLERREAHTDDPFTDVLDYGERLVRADLRSMADGSWTFDDVLDSAGPAPDQRTPIRVRVRVTKLADEITFDFDGSDAQRGGNVNAPFAVTVSAVAFALRSVLDPSIPANGGALRPVHIAAPPGSVVSAVAPVAVGAGNVEVSQRIADVCLGALAQARPDRVGAASQGTMNNVLVGGDGWVYYETVGGGQGGRPGRPGQPGKPGQPGQPGQSGIHTGMTNTRNTPIEALERAFPLRVLRQRLRRGSGGAGSAPGGEGIERDVQVLVDATVSLITERRVARPWGLAGGQPGAVGENWLLPGGDEHRAERLPDKCTIRLKAGDVLRRRPPGGGGWGAPHPNG
jgi:N-methylhydantoinase B/oxoprolinase/acetone carboxylase alpha subunit